MKANHAVVVQQFGGIEGVCRLAASKPAQRRVNQCNWFLQVNVEATTFHGFRKQPANSFKHRTIRFVPVIL